MHINGGSSLNPIAKFGVISDIQYADEDSRVAIYDQTKIRYYRLALEKLSDAFQDWSQMSMKPSFVLQLGDLIDGINATSKQSSYFAINKTLSIFESYSYIPTYHTLGNHELYNFKRDEIVTIFRYIMNRTSKIKIEMGKEKSRTLYYKFSPVPGLKIISLDCYEISLIGYDCDEDEYLQAFSILKEKYSIIDFTLWDTAETLESGLTKRFQLQNGAISKEQINWLDKELELSDINNECVIIFGHVCIHPNSCDPSCLLWNYNDVLNVFHRHKSILCYISGHTHSSKYCKDEKGIYYIVMQSVIEADPKHKAFATLTLYENSLEIESHGNESNKCFNLKLK